MKKLDMLFFLGIFAAVYGILLVTGWFIFGGILNLLGVLLLGIGVFLIIARPKPPGGFFLGRIQNKVAEEQDVTCWCGRHMKAGTRCDHGTGVTKDS